MRARIKQEHNFYVGQIYGQWTYGGLFEKEGWETVTPQCFTKWGARIELIKWKRKHVSEEFEI